MQSFVLSAGAYTILGSINHSHASFADVHLKFQTAENQSFNSSFHVNSTTNKDNTNLDARASRRPSLSQFQSEARPFTTTHPTQSEVIEHNTETYSYHPYPYHGFYSQDQSVTYPLLYPSPDLSSYSQLDEHGHDASGEPGLSRHDMTSGSGSAVMAPYPFGMYYPMHMYQQPSFCFAGPSGVPMVGYTYPPPPFNHGTVPTSMEADAEHSAHSAGGFSSTHSPGYNAQFQPDSMYVNISPAVYSPMSYGNVHGYGHYVYHDPYYYYNYSSTVTPMPSLQMARPPIPMASGYSVLPSNSPTNMNEQQSQQGIGASRRRRTAQQSSHGPRRVSPSIQSQKRESRDKPTLESSMAPMDSGLRVADASLLGQTTMSFSPQKDLSPDPPEISLLSKTTQSECLDNQLHKVRSSYVMWCGNVPSDATIEELWTFFSNIPEYSKLTTSIESKERKASLTGKPEFQTDNAAGILSIFIIARSSCAFVNYASQAQLDSACAYFHGRPLRIKPSCPRLVCRPRKLEDAEYAGVAAQRGKGVHTNWFREQRKLEKEREIAEGMSPKSLEQQERVVSVAEEQDERSFSSTNSSLLRHPYFSTRYFILKSRSQDALVSALRTNTWSTQPHNEPVLDQAFRNSNEVILFFSENFSGQFFGYAVMTSRPGRALATDSSVSSFLKDGEIPYSDFAGKNRTLQAHGGEQQQKQQQNLDQVATPATSMSAEVDLTRGSEFVSQCQYREHQSQTSDTSVAPSVKAERQAQEDLALGAKLRNLELDQAGSDIKSSRNNSNQDKTVDRSLSSYQPKATSLEDSGIIHASRSLQVGQPFYIEWKVTNPLPFGKINSLKNPWRDNRLVKVSRDGTELEPSVGKQLISVWQAYLEN